MKNIRPFYSLIVGIGPVGPLPDYYAQLLVSAEHITDAVQKGDTE